MRTIEGVDPYLAGHAARVQRLCSALARRLTLPARDALTVEILRSTSSLPPHIVGLFEEPIGFQQSADGPYYVFDRRGHTVYTVDEQKTFANKITEIGQEQGRIIQPRGFDTTAGGTFVIADAHITEGDAATTMVKVPVRISPTPTTTVTRSQLRSN